MLVVVGAAAVLVLGACSSSSSSSTSASDESTASKPTIGAAKIADVTIKTFQFSPNPATVKAGAITVRNDDNTTHTFTSDTGEFDLSINGPGASKTATVKPGTYKYHCAIHTSMTGELIVK